MTNSQTKTLVQKDGTKVSFFQNKLHSYDGPAIQPPKDSQLKPQYYVYGKEVSKKEWEKILKDREGIPFHKTAAGRTGLRK